VRVGPPALAVLQDADRLLDGWRCDCSAECCDFRGSGREPYVTSAEFAILEADVARQGRKLPGAREDGLCPFLAADGKRCTVYAARPLGCRTFYCERASGWGAFPRKEIAELPRALEDLSGAKGRPLTRWLPVAGRRGRRS
jgi:uncharacterized protein